MSNIIFVLKKDSELLFVSENDFREKQSQLEGDGYSHYSTIDAVMILNKVSDVLVEEYSNEEKIKDIIETLNSF